MPGGFKKIFHLFLCLMFFFNFVFTSREKLYGEGFWDKWSGEVFLGYNQSTGNTEKGSGTAALKAARAFKNAEFEIRANGFYSESDRKRDNQRLDTLAEYSFDFGPEKRWYNFYRLQADHDYFADIDYRVTPSTGVGYHILREKPWLWNASAGLGYRVTRHRVDTGSDDETLTGVVSTFIKRDIFNDSYISQEATFFPGFKEGSGFLIRSDTVFNNPLTENLDLEVRYILYFDSEPSAGKKKTDTQIVAGLKYSF